MNDIISSVHWLLFHRYVGGQVNLEDADQKQGSTKNHPGKCVKWVQTGSWLKDL